MARLRPIGVFSDSRLNLACALLRQATDSGEIPGAALCVGDGEGIAHTEFCGRHATDAPEPLADNALFLVASLTKPVTVTAAMMLVERGLLTLDDRVAEFVPAFAQNGKADVCVRHLMTHTSGLPDMPPNNESLRAAHQPLSAFIETVVGLPLLFPPGTNVRYQSMGIAMLAEIVRVVAGVPLPAFLRSELFEPLGMNETSLGMQTGTADRIAMIRLPAEQNGTTCHWNTTYWRSFGAPWGGLITTPRDYARFCQTMLRLGTLDGTKVLGPATVRAMTTNQLVGMPQVPEEERRCRPWGLGWRLNWPGQSANFGDLLGPHTFGHWGSTGTLCWVDPDADAFCLVLTTQPQGDDGRYLSRVSNAVAAALA